MDDNATCHRTLAVQDCLDSEGIQRLVWPARSPYLNPIENVWDALGRQVAGRNDPPTNKNTLIRALTEEWDKLPQQLLDNVVQIKSCLKGANLTSVEEVQAKTENLRLAYPKSRSRTVTSNGSTECRTRKKLTDVYGEGVLTVRQCQNWFAKFRSGNFDVEDAPGSGWPVEADKDAIKALVDANRRITREVGLMLNLSNSTVYDHLKGLGLSSKLDVWVPHVLTEKNLCHRIDVCDSLLKRHENYPFLKRIITGDEKGHGAKKMNSLKPFPKPKFTKKR
ncbi:histone-lysine N-methyltransferase SETMAR [Trichonephila clavipes]|nr:histone-lysine N-methyltransferase SETMAR [Trichonephila clavipes]